MGDLKIIKAGFFGDSRIYTVIRDENEEEIDCASSDCSSREFKDFEKRLPLEIQRAALRFKDSPKTRDGHGQVCSVYMFGSTYAGFMEPTYREADIEGFGGVVDMDGNGSTDYLTFRTTDGIEVSIADFDPRTLSEKSYVEFRCADVDISRRGVRDYLLPFDEVFTPTFGGLIHSLITMFIPIEPFIQAYYASQKPVNEITENTEYED